MNYQFEVVFEVDMWVFEVRCGDSVFGSKWFFRLEVMFEAL